MLGKKRLLRSWALPWVIAFWILNLAVTQDGEKNPYSRLAAMRALTEEGTLHIDRYLDWTIDWSQAPNGHYYSNKAPGGILLAMPVFAPLDWLSKKLNPQNLDDQGRRGAPGYFHKVILCLVFQLIPFGLLALWIDRILAERGSPRNVRRFAVVALLFGQSAAFFMNSWFGHGFAAVLFLAAGLALYERRNFWVGCFWGCALLTEYAVAVTAPALLLAYLWRDRNLRFLPALLAGGLAPGLLWVWYHTICFGGPLALATQFYNPVFLDLANVPGTIGGTLYRWPQLSAITGLAFGQNRGILFTQPWVLIGFAASIFWIATKRKNGFATILSVDDRSFMLFAWCSFVSAFLFNAMVGAWAAGYSAGPRYLAFSLPTLAFALALSLPDFSRSWQRFIFLGLIMAFVFRAAVYGTTILIPDEPLWPWLARRFLQSAHGTEWLRFAIFAIVTSIAFWWQSRFDRSTSSPTE